MTKKREIRVFARGGLGNQLFQYGAALNLSKKLSLPIVIDDLFLSSATLNKKVGKRELELDSFSSDLKFFNNKHSKINIIRSKILSYQRLIGDKAPKLLAKTGYFANEVTDQFHVFNKVDKAIVINSYCGHPKFFGNLTTELVNNITQIKSPSGWYATMKSQVLSDSPTGIHLRLGDYKNFPNIYGKPDLKYFSKAMNLLQEINGLRPIWVFSDEPDEAEEFFSNKIHIDKVIDANPNHRPIEHLNLLGSCKNIICSNSSFSWWAGFIRSANDENGQVIFPRPMFVGRNIAEPRDWLHPNWLTVGREI